MRRSKKDSELSDFIALADVGAFFVAKKSGILTMQKKLKKEVIKMIER